MQAERQEKQVPHGRKKNSGAETAVRPPKISTSEAESDIIFGYGLLSVGIRSGLQKSASTEASEGCDSIRKKMMKIQKGIIRIIYEEEKRLSAPAPRPEFSDEGLQFPVPVHGMR